MGRTASSVHSTHTKFSKKVYRYRKILQYMCWIMIAIQQNLLKNVFIALFFPFLAYYVLFKEMEKDYIIVTSLVVYTHQKQCDLKKNQNQN